MGKSFLFLELELNLTFAKKTTQVKLISIILSSLSILNAQSFASSTDRMDLDQNKKSDFYSTIPSGYEKPNSFKINLFPLAFKQISFEFERSFTPYSSAGVRLGAMPAHSSVLAETALALREVLWIFVLSEPNTLLNNSIQGFSFSPYYKLNLNGKGKGFYLSPYFKYANYNLTYNLEITNTDDVISTRGTLSQISGRAQIGCQWE